MLFWKKEFNIILLWVLQARKPWGFIFQRSKIQIIFLYESLKLFEWFLKWSSDWFFRNHQTMRKIWENDLEIMKENCYNESDSVSFTVMTRWISLIFGEIISEEMNTGIIMFTYRVNDAGISEREFHSTFFKTVGENNFISVIWIFCKSTTSWHCSCCPVVISHDTFIHTNHLKRRRKTCLDIIRNFSPCCQHYRWL